jgi:MFS family permease
MSYFHPLWRSRKANVWTQVSANDRHVKQDWPGAGGGAYKDDIQTLRGMISATFTVAIVEREPALAGQGALAWALVGLAAMPAVFLWDRVARRVGDIRALLLAFGLQTVSIVLPALSGSLAAALAGAVGYGATFIGIVSLTLALVGRRAPQNPGKAMARLTLSYGAAQMIAPIVAGAMAQATGSFKGALWLTAAVMLVGMVLLLALPKET